MHNPYRYLEVIVDGEDDPISLGRYREDEASEELEAWFDDLSQLADAIEVEINDLIALQIRDTKTGKLIVRRRFGSRWKLRQRNKGNLMRPIHQDTEYYRPRGGALLAERRSYDDPPEPVDLLLEYNARLLMHPAAEGRIVKELREVVGDMIQSRSRDRDALRSAA